MGKLSKCEYSYSPEAIERDIATALKYDKRPECSIAHSQSAIAKILYNIMVIMDNEKGEGDNGKK